MSLTKNQVEVIYDHVKGHTWSSEEGIVSLIHSTEYVLENHIPGDLLECGVFVGGNIQVMILTSLMLGRREKHIWAYDTFRGMPEPKDIDIEFGKGPAKYEWERNRNNNSVTGSKWNRYRLRMVKKQIEPLGYPMDHLHFVKGMVEDTIPGQIPEKIALARFDTDFYTSTKHEFTHLYPRVSSGGIIYVDDYGAFLGSQVATDEYIEENNLTVTLEVVDTNIRRIVKP